MNDFCLGSAGWGWVLHFTWNAAVAIVLPILYAGIVIALRLRAASADLPVRRSSAICGSVFNN